MIEIVPAILTDSPEELVRLAHILERAGVKRVHLDILDDTLVPGRTIVGYEELLRIESGLEWDVHLMVSKPEDHIAHYGDQVKRFIVHTDSVVDVGDRELWRVFHPGIDPTAQHGVTFMTVHPGKQGNLFLPEVVPAIAEFHAAHPDVRIMVDGGIGPDTAPQCAAAGASVLVSGSYIVRSEDPGKAVRDLRDRIEG